MPKDVMIDSIEDMGAIAGLWHPRKGKMEKMGKEVEVIYTGTFMIYPEVAGMRDIIGADELCKIYANLGNPELNHLADI